MPEHAAARAHREVLRLPLTGRAWIGTLTAAGAAWCVALLVWAQHGTDEAAVRWSAGLDPRSPLIALASAASSYGKPLMGGILLAALVASVFSASWRRHRAVFLLTLLSFAISGLAGDLLKELVGRPRPSIEYSSLGFAAHESTTSSFPSGHSTKAVALALPFLVFVGGWRGWRGLVRCALAGLALSVCASRVVLGAHFPSDVTGGLAMALSGLPFAVWGSNLVLDRMNAADLDRASRIWIGVYAVMILLLWWLS